ncbi:MAG: dUTP diphosphatase [Microcoleaceae cyanobacterium]
MQLKVLKSNPDAILPQYAHAGDAGLDLFSVADLTIQPGESQLVPTGIAIELPAATEAQVRPRSGLALKHQITVLNTPGTIDAGYRGEIGVILINHGKQEFQVKKGMKIAQLVIASVLRVDIEEVEALTGTTRGVGGFGSTGMGSSEVGLTGNRN